MTAALAVAAAVCAVTAVAALLALAHATRDLDAAEERMARANASWAAAYRDMRARAERLRHNYEGPHGWELDRRATVWWGGKWHYGCVVVAVSHRGAVAVRHGSTVKWIGKHRAPRAVRFEEADG